MEPAPDEQVSCESPIENTPQSSIEDNNTTHASAASIKGTTAPSLHVEGMPRYLDDVWQELNSRLESFDKARRERLAAAEPGGDLSGLAATSEFTTPDPPSDKEKPPVPNVPANESETAAAALSQQAQHPAAVNGSFIDGRPVNAEISFQHFLGKTFEPNAADFSDSLSAVLNQTKKRTDEVVYGWRNLLRESFADRLGRLRREIPEVILALNSFSESERFTSLSAGAEDGDLLSGKLIADCNADLSEQSHLTASLIEEFTRTSAVLQRHFHGPANCPLVLLDSARHPDEVNLISLSAETGDSDPNVVALLHGGKVAAGPPPKTDKASLEITDLNQLNNVLKEIQADRVDQLDRRLQRLSATLRKKEEEGGGEVGREPKVNENKEEEISLFSADGKSAEGSSVIESLDEIRSMLDLADESKLEAMECQVRLLSANLELLTGRPLPEDDTASHSPDAALLLKISEDWTPEKRLARLFAAMKGCKEQLRSVEALSEQLKGLSGQHASAAEAIGAVSHQEMQNQHMAAILKSNNELLTSFRASLEQQRKTLETTHLSASASSVTPAVATPAS